MQIIGSKADVYFGKATRTSGGLKREDLMMNQRNRVISRKAYEAALTRYETRKNDLINSAREGKRRKGMDLRLGSSSSLPTPFCGVFNAKYIENKVLTDEQRLKLLKERANKTF